MKILFVVDQFFGANNGRSISAQRSAAALIARGNEVRILCSAPGRERTGDFYAYLLPVRHIPFFDKLVTAQGMQFAQPMKLPIAEAVAWADVVHCYMPFALTRASIRAARKLGKPYTAAFHVQPENVSFSIGMGTWRLCNRFIYALFYRWVYRSCTHIHCPSEFIAGELKKNGYKAKLHVISNGIDPAYRYAKLPKTPELAGRFVVLSVGRYSREKQQDVIIEAVARSRHAREIQLVLAGQGPSRRRLERLGKKLPHPPVFRFFAKDELVRLISMSDLYVHASVAEIEAMSCMEAFAGGLVPVIADSAQSATPQFALDERSLFRPGDAGELAARIDYWIEHPEERKAMELRYSESASKYALSASAEKLESMFREAVGESRAGA